MMDQGKNSGGIMESVMEDLERCRLTSCQNNGPVEILSKKNKANRAFTKWCRGQKGVKVQKAKLRLKAEPNVKFLLPPKRRGPLQPLNCFKNSIDGQVVERKDKDLVTAKKIAPEETGSDYMGHEANRAFNQWRRVQKCVKLHKSKMHLTAETKVPHQQPNVKFLLPPKRRRVPQSLNCLKNPIETAIKIAPKETGSDYMDHELNCDFEKLLL